MDFNKALTHDEAEHYLDSVVCLNKICNIYALLLAVYEDGVYTSAGFATDVLVPEKALTLDLFSNGCMLGGTILFNAAAGTELPFDWPTKKVHRCRLEIKDGSPVLEASEELYSIIEIDFNKVKSLWKDDRPNQNPSIYKLSDGHTAYLIGIDY